MDLGGGLLREYQYDVDGRLAYARELAITTPAPLPALDLGDGDWEIVAGTWSVNNAGTPLEPSDDWLEETSSAIGAALYRPDPLPEAGFTFEYWSAHDPDDADGDENEEGELDGDDHPAKYYAQVYLAVESTPVAPPYPYAALRIEPDRLSVVHFDGTTIHELDSVWVRTEKETWYTVALRIVVGGPDGVSVSVERRGPPGDAVAVLRVGTAPGDLPDIESDAIGFSVGALADYRFRLLEAPAGPDAATAFTAWTRDALGRVVAEQLYDDQHDLVASTHFVWDGWRLAAILDAASGQPRAAYVHGPGHVDDVAAFWLDADGSGSFSADERFFPLADHQGSTVAFLDGTGAVAARVAYDPFGAATLLEPDGTPDPGGTPGLVPLFTGRHWLPDAGLYDYRNRALDPATGRFTTRDPVHDPANLGNPYTYVGNNPMARVDPWGLETYNPLRDISESFTFFVLGRTLGGRNTPQVNRPPQPAFADNPFAPLEDFDRRIAAGDHTRGLPQVQAAATAGIAAGIRGVKESTDDAASLAQKNLVNHAGGVEYFTSFKSLKRKLGPPGEGKVWHHVVEQSQLNRFGAAAIHNTSNVVAVPTDVNIKLNALYSGIRPEITGVADMTVRQWLRAKSYEEAREFGLNAIRRVMQGTWP